MAVAVLSSMALSINTDRNCHGTLVGKLILPARSRGKEFEVSKMAVERVVLYLFLSYNDVKMALGSKMAVGDLYFLALLEVFKMADECVVLYLFLSYNDVKMALGSKMAVGDLYFPALLEVFKNG